MTGQQMQAGGQWPDAVLYIRWAQGEVRRARAEVLRAPWWRRRAVRRDVLEPALDYYAQIAARA